MNISRKKNKSGTVLEIEGELTIYTVTQAQQSLLENPDLLVEPISLDLHRVSEIDTAGLQLLLFVQKHLSGIGKKMQLTKSNEQVDAIFAQLDIASYFIREN